MTPKKILKLFISFFILGVCFIYTCKFIAVNYSNKGKMAHIDDTGEEAVISPSPSDILPSSPDPSSASQDYDIGWERIKHAFLPELTQLEWTAVGEEYVVAVENVSYKVTDACIQKEWNPIWNFDVLYDLGMYSFQEDRSLKGSFSFVSVKMTLKNLGQDVCNCCLGNIPSHIYDGKGGKIMSCSPCTTSKDKPHTKSFFYEKISPGKEFDVELVYVFEDRYLDDSYYYFIDANPWAAYPTSEDEIGIFKLPLGAESESYDKE